MSDIFISYAREDTGWAQRLAEALMAQGWSVWWDREIPAGKTFSQVISEASANAQCIVVVWSHQSVNSHWVREEAEEGRNRGMLIPVLIEDVILPMGFRSIQAADLVDWDGTEVSLSFQKLVADVTATIGPASRALDERERPSQTEELPQSLPSKKARKKTRFRVTIGIGSGIAAAIVVTVLVFVALYREFEKPSPTIPTSEGVRADIYSHQLGFTREYAKKVKNYLEENGIPSQIRVHKDPNPPDAIFIGALVDAKAARVAISSIPYEIKYIFRQDYPNEEGGDPSGLLIGIGYISTHFKESRGSKSEPVKLSAEKLKHLTEPGLSNSEFQLRLREITRSRPRSR